MTLFGGLRRALPHSGRWASAVRAHAPAPSVTMRHYSQTAPEAPAAAETPAPAAVKETPTPDARVSLDSAVPFTPLPGFEANPSTPAPIQRVAHDKPHRMHIRSTRNNTIITFTTPLGEPLANASGGTVGFKKAGRSGYEAGYRAALSVFQRITENRRKWGVDSIEMLWNGFGQGREAVFRALMANEGEQVRGLVHVMTDKTPIKVGGVRPKKRRML
ncbi:hypothetical protein MCUN1_003012 [Malassezia cuniculi]|uniref:37S ribosomal protein S18, mitochondrial n=1 Tax=Malassezia cuniculi TaxID=948313 RepID=A0AAF0EWQ5_9BASI|nr:hypothetical protein MCUN1_003012 [Malassezia cuniculi]